MDVAGLQTVSALRRGIITVTTLLIINYFAGLELAVIAGAAAFLVGLAESGGSPRSTWMSMAVLTVALAITAVVMGACADIVWLNSLILLIMAFAIGVARLIYPKAQQVLVFCVIFGAAFVVEPQDPGQVGITALVVALGGILQTLSTLAASPFTSDLPERKAAVVAVLAVARNCVEVADNTKEIHEQIKATSLAFTKSENVIRQSDLDISTQERFLELLGTIDTIRLECRAMHTRSRLGLQFPSDQATFEVFVRAGEVLKLASRVLSERYKSRLLEELDREVTALRSMYSATDTSLTAATVLQELYELPAEIRSIVEERHPTRHAIRQSVPLKERVRLAFDPKGVSFRHGVRLVIAVFLAIIIALILQLPTGGWIIVTALNVLRPDTGPTTVRIIRRVIGTTVGVAIVTGILFLVGTNPLILFLLVGAAATGAFGVKTVNYGIYTSQLTVTMVMLNSIGYTVPYEIALSRWIDVGIGCVIGIALAFLFPLWTNSSLASQVSNYVSSLAEWFRSIGVAAGSNQTEREAALADTRETGSKARANRLMANAALETAMLEPTPAELNVDRIAVIVNQLRRCSDAGLSAEALLRHGKAAGPKSVEAAQQTAENLDKISELVLAEAQEKSTRGSSQMIDELPAELVSPIQENLVSGMLQLANNSSFVALQAAGEPGPSSRTA